MRMYFISDREIINKCLSVYLFYLYDTWTATTNGNRKFVRIFYPVFCLFALQVEVGRLFDCLRKSEIIRLENLELPRYRYVQRLLAEILPDYM